MLAQGDLTLPIGSLQTVTWCGTLPADAHLRLIVAALATAEVLTDNAGYLCGFADTENLTRPLTHTKGLACTTD